MKRSVVFCLSSIACVLTSAVIAQTPKKAPVKPAAAPAAQRVGNVRIRNQGSGVYDQAQAVHRLTRNVVVTQDGEDFILYCQELVFNERTNEAVARGNLRIETRDSTIIGNSLRADFTAKMFYLTGTVVMKSHGEKDGIQATENTGSAARSLRGEVLNKASSLTCDRIDYSYENRQGRLSGNIRMRQGQNFGTCEQIVFDEERNVAELLGNVKFTDDKGQSFNTRKLIIWIDENKIESERPVRIEIPVKNERNTPAAPARKFGTPPALPPDVLNEFRGKVPPIPPVSDDDEPAEEASTSAPTPRATETVEAPAASTTEPAGG
jgi:lipopolysaccharide assembly outer membrane protein LptD (OstA)